MCIYTGQQKNKKRTAGRYSVPLNGLEFVSDEGVHPEVAGEEQHYHEGIDDSVVHPQRLLLDDANAVLLLVAKGQNSLIQYRVF